MSTVNRIVYECVDTALSSFDGIDKKAFYSYLKEKYELDFYGFADNFKKVHEALSSFYGNNHFRIERAIIRILNDRAKRGVYERNDEITAFGCMINVFIAETEKRVKQTKENYQLSAYAKTLEQKVKEADDKMKASERMVAIGETAAMVGHDIRNPLQAIVGELFLQKTEIDTLPDGETKKNLLESVRSIEDNLYYVNKIVADLQDFAKPQRPQEKEQVDADAAIKTALSMVPIPENVEVKITINKDIPNFCANYQMLKRALGNLIQNAVQAMPKGGTLTIKAYHQENRGFIVIQDTGGGIPEEVKANLFKPLFTTKAKGQGLGLAVVKRLVDAMDGKVSFESQNGNGAKFFIQLPIKPLDHGQQ